VSVELEELAELPAGLAGAVRGLDDVAAWQMRLLSGLGFIGYY
jgi:hypothetical protein